MKRAFKNGDLVFYGVVRGILVGTFNGDQGLFFAHERREGFQTRAEITKTKAGASKIIDYLIKEYFGYKKTTTHSILEQPRFIALALQDLKHMSQSQVATDTTRLIRQRHLYLQMAKSYVRTKKSEEAIHRICGRAEELQSEIELEECHRSKSW
jgi:hypothetical protein